MPTGDAPQIVTPDPAAPTPEGALPADPEVVEPTPPPAEPDPSEDFSRKFALLAQRERKLVERERSIKDRLGRAEPVLRAIEEKNPMAILQSAGFSFQDVTNWVLNDGKKPEPTTDDRIAQLERQLEAERQARLDDAKRKESDTIEKTISQHKATIKSAIDTAGDEFELIRAHEAYDTVFDVIENYFLETQKETGQGQILSIEDAARQVEEYLDSQAQRFMKTKKYAPKPQEPAPTGATPEASAPGQKPQVSTTLTNRMVNPAPAPREADWLSEEESKRRAAAMIRWTD